MLLVAEDQIRMATMEESAASDTITKDMALTADQKHSQDMTGVETPKRRQMEVPQMPDLPALRKMPEAVRALETTEEDPQEQVRAELTRLVGDITAEDREMDLKGPEDSPPAAQQPLALTDFAHWAAQKGQLAGRCAPVHPEVQGGSRTAEGLGDARDEGFTGLAAGVGGH